MVNTAMFRRLMAPVVASLAWAACMGPAHAQAWPDRALRIIIPFTPGGGPDLVMRLMAEPLGKRLGQSVVIENRPGANGIIALESVAKATPDGHTLGLGDNGSLAINPSLYRSLSYNVERDFAPITLIYSTPFFMAVHASVPARSYSELIALLRANPGKYNFGSSGSGSPTHLDWEVLKQATGVQMTHVPHKGLAPLMQSLLAGDVAGVFLGWTPLRGAAQQGKIRVLMVGQAQRSPAAPDVPSATEAGAPEGFTSGAWAALIAPRAVRSDVLSRVHAEFVATLREPEIRSRIEQQGFTPGGGSSEELVRLIASETRRYAAAVAFSGAKAD